MLSVPMRLEWLPGFVLQYGEEARVMAPAALRKLVKERLSGFLERFSEGP